MTKNRALHDAAKAKQDEFYTDLWDIEQELKYYQHLFKGKTVLCNCDDPYESNFFKYFAALFNHLELKKLIATCYSGSPIAQQQLSLFEEDKPTPQRKPYCAVINELKDFNGDKAEDLEDIEWILTHNHNNSLRILEGNGDFRSPECVELLKEADIVVTNPPHSLLREYIAQLVEYGKQFLILGNINAITYKEIFPLIMQNKMWMGVNSGSGTRAFKVPEYYEERDNSYWQDEEGQKYRSLRSTRWLTNLEHKRRHLTMTLWKNYAEDPSQFPKYDNYNAIEVSKVSDIPFDYEGVMGVPITFLDKYNPEQFEILGIDGGDLGVSYGVGANLTKEECIALFKENKGFRRGKLCFRDSTGQLKMCYRRLLIRRIGGIY